MSKVEEKDGIEIQANNTCHLCGREIISKENCFGLTCLNKMGKVVGINKISNLKKESFLNFKIQLLNWKWFLNKEHKQMLTNRYLTYKILNKVEIKDYKDLSIKVNEDVKKINNKTSEDDLKSNTLITLKDAFEIFELYSRYKNILTQTDKYSSEELSEELQNLPWDTLLFAFSSYYEKKPYLSSLIQVVQRFVWKAGAKLAKKKFKYGSEFLEHSLQENPENLYITDGGIIDKIKDDGNFKNKVKQIIQNCENETEQFETQDSLRYKSKDLFLALNKTKINVKGIKENDKWSLEILITDTYDFTDLQELDEYVEDNIFEGMIGSLLNNSAMVSTAFNVINEYNVTIKFNMKEEELYI